MSTIERAIEIAVVAHRGAVDKGGHPYILHPLRVMLAMGDDVHGRMAAVLHDVIEDAAIRPEYLLQQGMPPEVVDAVMVLTRRQDEEYMGFIRRCLGNELARRVKIADLRDNMDLSRIPNPTLTDKNRANKYFRALDILRIPSRA